MQRHFAQTNAICVRSFYVLHQHHRPTISLSLSQDQDAASSVILHVVIKRGNLFAPIETCLSSEMQDGSAYLSLYIYVFQMTGTRIP